MAITATVVPGVVIEDGVTPLNAATLNLLGSPTVSVTGNWSGVSSVAVDNATIDVGGAGGSLRVKDGAITAAKLASLAVQSGNIDAGAVTVGKIGALAVDSGKLADGAVTAGKIAAGAVTAAAVDWSGGTLAATVTPSLDWSLGLTYTMTTTGNTTITFLNGVDGQSVLLAVVMSGSHTLTWVLPSATYLKWKEGAAPTPSASGKTDIYSFVLIGATYYGAVVKNFA